MLLDASSRSWLPQNPGRLVLGALVAMFASASGPSALGQDGPLGLFDGHGDVGSPQIAGSATYNAVSQEYALRAAGVNMWAQRDEFHFVWKKLKGDFILQARVEFVGAGVDPHRKLGFIVRSTLEADSPYADVAVHGDGLTSLQYRRTKGAITEQVQSTQKAPDVIQLERKGTPTPSPRPGSAIPSPRASSRISPWATRFTWASFSARTTPLWWRRGSFATCASFAPRRRASFPTATTSEASWRSSRWRPAVARWS